MKEPNMDKEWLNFPRASQAYHQGVNRFLDFAFRNVGTSSGEILCPCTRCVNGLFQKRETVEEHLVMRGFANHYRIWTDHGEVIHGEVQGEGNTPLNDVDNRDPVHEVEVDRMPELVNDVLRNQLQDDPCTKAAKFEKYMNEANQELYPGCKSETKLSFIVWLVNLKCTSKWSDKSFDMLIDKLRVIIPAGEQLPANYYETKKLIGDLGFSYEKIDVCPNDCMLYWKENNKKRSCSVCKEPRWKTVQGKPDDTTVVQTSKSKRHKVAVKQLRHFSLTQALQRMYMSPETAIDMYLKDGKNRSRTEMYVVSRTCKDGTPLESAKEKLVSPSYVNESVQVSLTTFTSQVCLQSELLHLCGFQP
ncbi:hypothetical protein RJ639_002955 [Escallonia herrerae]|uniref:Transposase-associated domain-containing protein n=1 Tax=Escallonia herrerae TaxID=1293975 RepID=A0AA89AIC1_9ASTE|nr:hypothetical protein RJ639_019962 [Escallonia herrerae]KAK3019183.1 hypothetical protein RJ639_002955 [Escallonia herrerae]